MKVPATNSKAAKTQSKSVAKPAASKGSAASVPGNSKTKKSVIIVNEEDAVKEDGDNGSIHIIKEEGQPIEDASVINSSSYTSTATTSNKRKRSSSSAVAVGSLHSTGGSFAPVAANIADGDGGGTNGGAKMEVSESQTDSKKTIQITSTLSSNGEASFLDNIDNSEPTNDLFTFVPPTAIPFRGRSNTYSCLPNATESENLEMLRMGTKVVIKGTNIVMHKAPHLVGKIGIIVEVPVHPTTWFKVKFDDATIVPFRPSALHVFGSATSVPITHTHPMSRLSGGVGSSSGAGKLGKKTSSGNSSNTSLSSQISRQSGGSSSSKRKSAGSQDNGNSNTNSSRGVLLSTVDPDTWVGRSVIIMEGKLRGSRGVVLRSGNGWVQVESKSEEVPKRAYELEVVGGESSRKNSGGSDSTDAIPNPITLHRSSSVIPRSTGTAVGDSTTALPRMRGRPRSYSDTSIPSTKALFLSLKSSETSGAAAAPAAGAGASPEARKDPKISMALRQMKYDATQKYVERQSEVFKGRPDIGYWVTQVNGSLLNRNHEKDVSRPFVPEFCGTCNVEFWPGSHFCWNELCSASLIYWRHEGARGVPPPVSVSDNYNKYYGEAKDHTIQYQVRTNTQYSRTLTGENNYDYSTITNAYLSSTNYSIDDVIVPQCEKKLITVDTLQPSGIHVGHTTAPKLNIISEYLLSLPAQIVGRDFREISIETPALRSSADV